jgi:hypothetical protein
MEGIFGIMAIIFVVFALMIIKIERPYLMLMAFAPLLLFFTSFTIDMEAKGSILGYRYSELSKIFGTFTAIVLGAIVSIALAEIRKSNLIKQKQKRQKKIKDKKRQKWNLT